MACEGCTQKIISNDVVKEKAQAIADETKEWVGIYQEAGETKYAIGSEAVGKPITRWYTPGKENLQQHIV